MATTWPIIDNRPRPSRSNCSSTRDKGRIPLDTSAAEILPFLPVCVVPLFSVERGNGIFFRFLFSSFVFLLGEQRITNILVINFVSDNSYSCFNFTYGFLYFFFFFSVDLFKEFEKGRKNCFRYVSIGKRYIWLSWYIYIIVFHRFAFQNWPSCKFININFTFDFELKIVKY